jgi:hypothetical protein
MKTNTGKDKQKASSSAKKSHHLRSILPKEMEASAVVEDMEKFKNDLPKATQASAVVEDMKKFKNDLPKATHSLLPFKLKKKSRIIQIKK